MELTFRASFGHSHVKTFTEYLITVASNTEPCALDLLTIIKGTFSILHEVLLTGPSSKVIRVPGNGTLLRCSVTITTHGTVCAAHATFDQQPPQFYLSYSYRTAKTVKHEPDVAILDLQL